MKRVLTSLVLLVAVGCGSGGGGSGDAGKGGTSGAAGNGGTTGTGGDGGTAGTAGDGGTAGTAGTGGGGGATAGAGGTGTAGRGGTTGTAGRGGSGGTTGTAGRGGSGGTTGSGGSGACTATSFKLTQIASGLTNPDYITQPPGETGLFVAEQIGRIRVIRNGALLPTPFLDARTSSLGDPPATDSEVGFLGLAFHPQYASNGRFFVFYNRRATDPFSTGTQGDIVVAEGARGSSADVASATLKPLFVVPKKHDNHNGGMLAFGPDGNLYLGIGDDGDGTNSPMPTTKYGKILRVNVGSAAPATPNLDPTVVQLGLRNPWRFSFDRANGDMFIADVGERLLEEIDYVPAGTTGINFGWPTMEGRMCYATGCSMAGLTLPVYDYGRDLGQTVVGGYVYRGANIGCMRGRYIFADWNQPGLWSFVLVGGQVTNMLDHTALLNNERTLSSFGEDLAGELYVTMLKSGVVLRLDPN